MELWDKVTCRTCGKKYFFGDGPRCKCPEEIALNKEEYAVEMKAWDFIEESAGGNK